MFVLWNIFERYITDTRATLQRNPERSLEHRYKTILRHVGVDEPTYATMVGEFNLIRRTRNSLHTGGVYRNRGTCRYTLKGKEYLLEEGRSVTPIRIMDVVETLWQHFAAVIDRDEGCAGPNVNL